MPTYVFRCEGCGARHPFLVHEDPAAESSSPLQKHCPSCHAVTNWTLAFPERRSGRDRRDGSDRRDAE